MEKIFISFIHVFLLSFLLYSMLKLLKRIRERKEKNNIEHIEDVYEKAGLVTAIILLLMYVAMMCLGVGIKSCICLVVALGINKLNNN